MKVEDKKKISKKQSVNSNIKYSKNWNQETKGPSKFSYTIMSFLKYQCSTIITYG